MFFNVSSTLELAYTYRSFTSQILRTHVFENTLLNSKKKVLDISSFRKHTCAYYQENVDVLEINYRDSEVLNMRCIKFFHTFCIHLLNRYIPVASHTVTSMRPVCFCRIYILRTLIFHSFALFRSIYNNTFGKIWNACHVFYVKMVFWTDT